MKGCKYCRKGKALDNRYNEEKVTKILGSAIYVFTKWHPTACIIDINYCPMCGTQIREDEDKI